MQQIECWALRGYPLKPRRTTVVKLEPADRHTPAMAILADGTRLYRSLCYRTKPRLVKVSDQYGEISQWQGKAL